VDVGQAVLFVVDVQNACASHGGRRQHRTGVTMAGRFIGERRLITRRDIAARLATSAP
jgi:hypothetical protein